MRRMELGCGLSVDVEDCGDGPVVTLRGDYYRSREVTARDLEALAAKLADAVRMVAESAARAA